MSSSYLAYRETNSLVCLEHLLSTRLIEKLQVLSMLFYSKVLRLGGNLSSEFHELNHEHLDCLNYRL